MPDDDGHSSRVCSGGEGFRLTVYKRGFKTPEKFCRSIMYQIFPTASAFPTTILHRQALNITAASGKRRKCTEA